MQTVAFLMLVGALARSTQVAEIQIEGNRRVSDEAILFHLRPLREQSLTQPLIESTFRSLWETGLFEDIQFRQPSIPTEKTVLIVEVQEKAWLGEVRPEGQNVFRSQRELRQKLNEAGVDLRPLHPFGQEDARRAAATLEEILGRDYDVTAHLSEVDTERVDLVLTVEKRPSIRIESISFSGNETLDDSRLRSVMQLKPPGWTTRWTGRDRLDSRRLEADLERIRHTYRRRGFLTVDAGPAQIEQMKNGKVRLTIPIREGPVYRTGLFRVDPGFLIEEETVLSWLSLTPGSPHDASAVLAAVERIEKRYRDRGYGDVQVDVDERLEPASQRVNLVIRVRPGRLQSFGRIEFRGNQWLRDRNLRKHLEARERDRLSRGAIDADVRTLMALGVLRSVSPETAMNSQPDLVNLTYQLEEQPRFDYFLGGGSNGVQGTSGALSFIARDLLGQGETWNFEGEIGNRFGNFTVAYQDPFSLGHRLTWGASFVRQNIEYPDDTSDDLAGLAIRIGGPVGSRWQLQSGFQWASFKLTSTLATPVPFLTPFLGRRFRTNRLSLAFGYEGRNQPIFPTSGFQALLGAEAVGGVLGGDVSLFKLRARAQYVTPLEGSRRHLMSLRGRAESVWSFGNTDREGLPRFERLFLGSEDDLRGFPIREVGPKTGDEVPIGGDRLVFASLEYQFVLSPRARLVGFVDFGNVYARDLPETGLPKLRYDAGGELRILAPILSLPLRLGYGVNLNRLPAEPKGRFFFTLSARF